MTIKDQFSVSELLDKAASEMWLGFEKASQLNHPGEKGRAREDALRLFFQDYLPGRFGADAGFVIDATGRVSKQQDVVIYDKASAPVFRVSEDVRVFPVESVAAVIQVKSRMDSAELVRSVANLRSAVRLDRLAGGQPYSMAGGVMQTTFAQGFGLNRRIYRSD